MKQLVVNTFTELYPEPWSSGSSTPAMTSHDMVVLATAFCGIFGLLVSLGAIYAVVKVVCWICLDQPTGGLSECYWLVFFFLYGTYEPILIRRNTVPWFCDL